MNSRFPLIAVVLIAVGCGGDPNLDATVEGTVTIDGELATRGNVTFYPENDGAVAYGTIQKNGTFALRTGQGPVGNVDGAQIRSGEYVVTVVVNGDPAPREKDYSGPPLPGLRITPGKLASRDTSDLKIKVNKGPNVIPLNVERASEEEMGELAAAGAQRNQVPSDAEKAGPEGEPIAAAETTVGGEKSEIASDTTSEPTATTPEEPQSPDAANEPNGDSTTSEAASAKALPSGDTSTTDRSSDSSSEEGSQ